MISKTYLVGVSLLLLTSILCGCNVLRYNYEVAVRSLPVDSIFTHTNNTYIGYTLNGIPYKAYYNTSGTIYKIE